jgi:hypothetical protein
MLVAVVNTLGFATVAIAGIVAFIRREQLADSFFAGQPKLITRGQSKRTVAAGFGAVGLAMACVGAAGIIQTLLRSGQW